MSTHRKEASYGMDYPQNTGSKLDSYLSKNNDNQTLSTGRANTRPRLNSKSLLSSKRRFMSNGGDSTTGLSTDLVNDGIYQYSKNIAFGKIASQNFKDYASKNRRLLQNNQFFKNRNKHLSNFQKYMNSNQHISIKTVTQNTGFDGHKHGVSLDETNPYGGAFNDLQNDEFGRLSKVVKLSYFSIIELLNKTYEADTSSLSTLTIDQNYKISEALAKVSYRSHDKYKDINKIDCTQMLKNTDKELKGIKYKLSTVISSGEYHTNIEANYENKWVEAIKETPIYCKIPCKNEFAPAKITFTYGPDFRNDMIVYVSLTNPMPSNENCIKSAKNPKNVIIQHPERDLKVR